MRRRDFLRGAAALALAPLLPTPRFPVDLSHYFAVTGTTTVTAATGPGTRGLVALYRGGLHNFVGRFDTVGEALDAASGGDVIYCSPPGLAADRPVERVKR